MTAVSETVRVNRATRQLLEAAIPLEAALAEVVELDREMGDLAGEAELGPRYEALCTRLAWGQLRMVAEAEQAWLQRVFGVLGDTRAALHRGHSAWDLISDHLNL